MINGAHVILYTSDPEADRAFIRDKLDFPGIDIGGGWIVAKLPPAEVAVHPTDEGPKHELYLMCDDIEQLRADLAGKGVECSDASDEGWGLLASIKLPSGADLGIYEPRHPVAYDLDG
jgi:hypothetical protein